MTKTFSYQSMGVIWRVTIGDELSVEKLNEIKDSVAEQSRIFDETYSRFKAHSLVAQLSRVSGLVTVPKDLVEMLRWYFKFYDLSGGKITPLVSETLSDWGYDAEYSLVTKDVIRPVLPLPAVVEIISPTRINLKQPVLFDLGCLGKGYFIDKLYDYLSSEGLDSFMIDGSGDIRLKGPEPIRVGLEHPHDDKQVIGVVSMMAGAMASSGINRRRWREFHHLVEPHLTAPTVGLLSSWVIAERAVVADALATALFLCPPETFSEFEFEYCLINDNLQSRVSTKWPGDLFSS